MMHSHQVFCFISALLALLSLVQAGRVGHHRPDSSIVDLGYAIFQGTYNSTSDITDFFGIRYAAAPVGKLRFQPPAPPPNMRAEGVQLADMQLPGCPVSGNGLSPTSPFRNTTGNQRRQNAQIEDCLFLNVHVSGRVDPRARMPVVFWIHGGGYIRGTTQSQNGSDLIREAGGGIVAVEFDYRLGLFGFLPGSEVKGKGALNAGLLDQQYALKWVQKNIHRFGGDPDDVTIWGQSAGAGSVMQHMIAHGGRTKPPLFRRAITSSTFFPSQYNYDDAIPEQIYSETVRQSNCSNTTDTFQCLVDADAGALQNINVAINMGAFFGVFTITPVVDGEFIVERPLVTISRGRLNGEAVYLVNQPFEGTAYVNPNFTDQMTTAEYVTQLFPLFNQSQIDAAAAQYTNIGLPNVTRQAITIMGETIFICPTYHLLAATPGRSWKALLAIPPGVHGIDSNWYFPAWRTPSLFNNTEFQASFAGSFLGFAKFGDPGVRPVPNSIVPDDWNVYSDGNTEMLFNRTEDFQPDIRTITTDPGLLERCAFWKSLAPWMPQ